MNKPPVALGVVDAEGVLRRLFVGATVNGLRFGVLQLLFDAHEPGEPYLNLASNWRTFETRPPEFPDLDQFESEPSDLEVARAVTLRHKQVTSVEVLAPWPHLVITFTDETLLFLNGKDMQYEPWTAGLSNVPTKDQVQVIACPGGQLALLLPNGGANEA